MPTSRILRPAAIAGAGLALAVGSWTAFAGVTKTVQAPISVPVALDGDVAIDTSNNPGPWVSLTGTLKLGGVDVAAIFRNNAKGTHEYTDTTTLGGTLLPAGHTITIPKQPVRGGTGGNPFIWIQLLDGGGKAITGEIYLGRCVQGLNTFDFARAFAMAAKAAVDTDIDCTNNPGPWITFGGAMTLGGCKARFIFRNNDNPVGGPHEADATVDVTLVGAGTVIKFPKQPVLGGVGGNPWIWMQLSSGGEALTDEILLGRCVQDGK